MSISSFLDIMALTCSYKPDSANLSNDYFTNRQDRYHVLHSKKLTDYYASIHHAVCSISFVIQPSRDMCGYTMSWPTTNRCPSPLADPSSYFKHATSLLSPMIRPPSIGPISPSTSPATYIYPLFQFTPLFPASTPSTELPALTLLLRHLTTPAFTPSRWTFTAGYFNMTPAIRSLLLASRPAPHGANVVAASPWANGFYGSAGVSGLLPAAYTLLSRRFVEAVNAAGLGAAIALKEWRRGTVGEEGGWTYHAKGVWVRAAGAAGDVGPCVSLVGSSNYTARSYTLDLEANALIVTADPGLQARLAREEAWLQEYAKVVDKGEFERTERRVGLHVRIAMWIVKLVGGAL